MVLAVAACAVCRTDLQIVEGDVVARRLPIVPGHQVVGRVEALGEGVSGWSVGERAGVTWLAGSCGMCRACSAGRENLCPDATFTGWDRDGGFAERIVVRADAAVRLPGAFGDVEAAPLLCGGVVGYRALRLAGMGPGAAGSRLGLYGFGASALLCLQVARWWGVEVHVATRSGRERERARALGAGSIGGYDDPPPWPLDAAVTFAPAGDVVVAALRAIDRGGSVVVNAIHLDRIPEFSYEMLWWERSLRSVANVTRADAVEFLEVAAAIPIQANTETLPLDGANEALVRLSEGLLPATAVLVP
jgi:propanol-preferring alcohol dehydrogenase